MKSTARKKPSSPFLLKLEQAGKFAEGRKRPLINFNQDTTNEDGNKLTDARLTGTFEKYLRSGSLGIIQGNDKRKYLAYKISNPNIPWPKPGLKVTFGAMESLVEIENAKMLAYDIQEAKEPSVETSANAIIQPKPFKIETTLGDYMHSLKSDVLQTLTEEGAEVEEDKVHKYDEPSESIKAPQSIAIDQRVADAFRITSKISEFYSHQIKARNALLQGKHVIISTPTASGKTEAYNPTILEVLLRDPKATALYLFPLVALGRDQTDRLEKLNRALPSSDQLKIGIYNSNVSKDKKDEVLSKTEHRILVTTPDSLHYIFLPKPFPNWKTFYRNLRYVVIDEAHVYKGVFGANMANIIRRLLARCMREGNSQFPQLIISSATVLNPKQLAHQLSSLPEKDFEAIEESGAPKPGRHFLVTRSDIHDLVTVCSDLLNVKTVSAKTQEKLLVSTIVFLRSINEVKASGNALRDHLSRMGRRDERNLVDVYYSEKGDKDDVLVRLRNGKVRCLFATTALMAGIDIGSLDVAIVKNFPGLVMDARQMFGRAGRAGEGAVIFIANRTDPFDQFYFDRPEQLFQGPVEDVVINPENPILLESHLKCAAQTGAKINKEGPLSDQLAGLFGQSGKELLASLVSKNKLRQHDGSYYYSVDDPHDLEPLNDIRSMGSEIYSLKDVVNNQVLEKKRETTAFRDAHPNAIIEVDGTNYTVVGFDKVTREIKCQHLAESNLRTRGLEEAEINILSAETRKNLTANYGATIDSGKISITTSVKRYVLYKTHPVMQCRNRSCRYETPNLEVRRCPQCKSSVRPKRVEEVVDELDIPAQPILSRTMETRACWINFSEALKNKFESEFWPRWVQVNGPEQSTTIAPSFEYAIHSLKHAILKAFPERIPCDRDEIGGIYQIGKDGSPSLLFIYDNFPGGLGLSDEFSREYGLILEGALNLIERCTCIDDQGCPVCLSYFGCHDYNQTLSKISGRYLLQVLLGKDSSKVLGDLKEYVEYNIPSDQRVNKNSDLSRNDNSKHHG